jgi:PKD repeat protein
MSNSSPFLSFLRQRCLLGINRLSSPACLHTRPLALSALGLIAGIGIVLNFSSPGEGTTRNALSESGISPWDSGVGVTNLQWEPCDGGNTWYMRGIGNGTAFCYDSVDFGTGIDFAKFRFRWTLPVGQLTGGAMEFRLDSINGRKYAGVACKGTGDGCTLMWDSAAVTLPKPAGMHRLWLVVAGGNVGAVAFSHSTGTVTAPTVVIAPADTTVDAGGNVTLRSAVTGSPTISYQWTKLGSTAILGTGATLNVNNIQQQNQYICTVTNSLGSSADTAIVRVRTLAPVLTVIPADTGLLAGSSLTFRATATGTIPISYLWRKVGTTTSLGAATTLTLTNLQSSDSGARYECIASNSVGSDTAQGKVQVFTAVKAGISVPEPSAPVNAPIALRDSSTGSIAQWRWSFGDGTRDSTYAGRLTTMNHTFKTAGTYTVKLVVTGKNNLSKDSTVLSIIAYVVGDNPLRIASARPLTSTTVELAIKYIKSISTDPLSPPYAGKIDVWYGCQGLKTGPRPALDTALGAKAHELEIAAILPKVGPDSIYRDTVTVAAPTSLSDTTYGFWVSPVWSTGRPSVFNIANAGQAMMKPVNTLSLSAEFLGNTGTAANPVLNPAALDSGKVTIGNLSSIDTNAIAKVLIGYGFTDYQFAIIDSLPAAAVQGSHYIWAMRNPAFKEDTQRVHISVYLIGRNGLVSDAKKTTLQVGWSYPINTCTIAVTDPTTYSLRVHWTRPASADSVRILYGKSPISLGRISEAQIGSDTSSVYHVLVPENKTDTTLLASGLEITTTYYFAIQIMKDLHWSDVTPGGRGSGATRNFVPEDTVPNTMKIDSVWFVSEKNEIHIAWRVGAWNVSRDLGITASTDQAAALTTAPNSMTNGKIIPLDITTRQGESSLDISAAVQFGATYYIGLWLKAASGPWALPTDSSKASIVTPTALTWQRITYFNKDTISALGGNFLLRKDSLYTLTVQITDTVTSYIPPAAPAGITAVSVGASLKKDNYQPFWIGLRYDPALIPAGFSPKDIGMYRDSAGVFLALYGFSIDSANGIAWAPISKNGILRGTQSLPFVAMVDQTRPAIAIASDTSSTIRKSDDLRDTIMLSDNVANVKWWIKYRKDGEPYQISPINYVSSSRAEGDTAFIRIPAMAITEDNGIRAMFMVSDGVHTDSINISRQVLRAQSDGAYIEPQTWTPVWTTAQLDNKNVKSALRQLVPDGAAWIYKTSDFRLFRWYKTDANAADSAWIEYSPANETLFDFEPGRVAWVKTREPKSIDLGPGRSVSQKGPVEIVLQPRQWTDFAMPFRYDVAIGDVIAASGISRDSLDFYSWIVDPQYRYQARPLSIAHAGLDSSNFPFRSQSLVAYSVFNSLARPAVLRIPPIPIAISAFHKTTGFSKKTSGDRWSVRVGVRTTDGQQLNDIYCAYAPGTGAVTYHPLPPTFSSLRAGVYDRETMRVFGHAVAHTPMAKGFRFDIAFVNGDDQTRTFAYSAQPFDSLPDGYRVAFLDQSGDTWAAADRSATVSVPARSTAYRVLAVGTADFLGIVDKAKYGSLSLARCSITPGAGSVRIRYQIPAIGISAVSFSLHDLSGRLIWRKNIERGKGLHSGDQILLWNGKNLSNTAAPAGIYVLSLQGIDEKGKMAGCYRAMISYAR